VWTTDSEYLINKLLALSKNLTIHKLREPYIMLKDNFEYVIENTGLCEESMDTVEGIGKILNYAYIGRDYCDELLNRYLICVKVK
jgi:hypothetical protein